MKSWAGAGTQPVTPSCSPSRRIRILPIPPGSPRSTYCAAAPCGKRTCKMPFRSFAPVSASAAGTPARTCKRSRTARCAKPFSPVRSPLPVMRVTVRCSSSSRRGPTGRSRAKARFPAEGCHARHGTAQLSAAAQSMARRGRAQGNTVSQPQLGTRLPYCTYMKEKGF